MNPKTDKNPRGAGRPCVAPGEKLYRHTMLLTQDQWIKFGALGGHEWLRSQIDKQELPPLRAYKAPSGDSMDSPIPSPTPT